MISLSVQAPWLLVLAIPSIAFIVVLWRMGRAYLPPFRRRLLLGLRCAVILLVVAALADPSLRLPAQTLDVAILVQRSDSIGPTGLAQEQQWIEQALQRKAPQDRVTLISFGQTTDVQMLRSTESTPPVLDTSQTVGGTRTDIAAAIRMALGLLPPDSARRIVLLSNGQENLEQARTAAQLVAAAHVPLDMVTVTGENGPETLVSQLEAPGQVRQGQSFTVTAQVTATEPGPATLDVLADGELLTTQDVNLAAGVNRLAVPLGALAVGHHVIRAQIDAANDTRPENNQAGAVVVVTGPPRILLLEGTPGEGQYLAGALKAAGLQVDVSAAQAAPTPLDALESYAGVVLVDVPASALSAPQVSVLQDFVQSYGGGLLVVGGPNAYGPGGYSRTPLESMLPVTTDLRGASLSRTTALALVIDTSGSMDESIGSISILDAAKEAAIGAAEELGQGDTIGVVSFQTPSQWALPPTSASNLGTIESVVSQMTAAGGDDSMEGGLSVAYEGLANVTALTKHVIVLTDGEIPEGNYQDVMQQMQTAGITVSTIGIGHEINTDLLRTVASLGNGRYFDGNDLTALPQLVVKETQQAQRAAIVEGDYQALPVTDSPVLTGLDLSQMPALRGYVATTARQQSTVLLASNQADPLLAEWQYGLGHVMAWTSDATSVWASQLLSWSQSAQFWNQVVAAITRPPDDPNRQATVDVSGDDAQITLDAQTGVGTPERQYVNFAPATATVVDALGNHQQVPLPQVAPGEYQGSVPVTDNGVYDVQVAQTNPDGTTTGLATGFVVPYSPEYRAIGVDSSFLADLARITGGELLQDPAQAFAHTLPSVGEPQPLWPALAILAALLFVGDVATRRVRVSRTDVHAALGRAQERMGYQTQGRHRAAGPAAPRATTPVPRPSTPATAAEGLHHAPAQAEASRSARLLAAKQRAGRRV